MSAPHGCTDDTAVVESFKEALKQRIGVDRFRMWFARGVTFTISGASGGDDDRGAETSAGSGGGSAGPGGGSVTAGSLIVTAAGQFALDRIRKHFMRELRGAAMQAAGAPLEVRLVIAGEVKDRTESDAPDGEADVLAGPAANLPGASADRAGGGAAGRGRRSEGAAAAAGAAESTTGPASAASDSGARPGRSGGRRAGRGNRAAALSSLLAGGAATGSAPAGGADVPAEASRGGGDPAPAGPPRAGQAKGSASEAAGDAAGAPAMTMANFVAGPSNQLAYTAATMVCQTPGAATPLFLFGPTGVGKTHLLAAIAAQLRRRHRLRRVIHLSAEQFTNDFIKSVGSSGLPAFRRRYRDVDALLVDDVQFLGAKKATLREMLYTVETLSGAGRPLIFAGNQSPGEIEGLTRELAGRLAAGLVCPLQPLDAATRQTLLRRAIQRRCPLPWNEEMIAEVSESLSGDGRVISGVVNLVAMLQRMYRRMPTMDEIRQYGGEMLRAQTPAVSLSAIERAVCETFGLDRSSLRTPLQTRSITEPRMLAMYLSRELTSSAFSEIARHYGGRSHSTAIAASKKVQSWLEQGKSIGRGAAAMSAQQAVERIESSLRAG